MSRAGCFVASLLALVACGDNSEPQGPQPLRPDPAVQTACVPGPLAAGTTRAKPIACTEELIGGRLASGRVGDVLLENAHVRVIVRALGEGYYMHGTSGGGIVDAARVDGEDLIKEIQPAVDFAFGAFEELVITEAGDDGVAEIVVRGPATQIDILNAALGRPAPELVIEHHYRLAAGARAVHLETRVFPKPGTELEQPTLYDAVFTGGRATAFLPGIGISTGTGGAEIIATTGTTTSYGLAYSPDTPDPQLVDLAGIRVIVGPTLTSGTGAKRWLVIGDGSVSSVTDEAWALRGADTGTVRGTTAPGVDVVIADGSGAPITVARADSDGAFAATVPPGSYELHAESIGRAPAASSAASVTAGAETSVTVAAGPTGTIQVSVHDTAGTPLPARVVVEQMGKRRITWTGVDGQLSLPVQPGMSWVSVSRGLEYDAFVASALSVADGQSVPLNVTLERVVDTSGWIALDTHLHSELSTDSTLPIDDRLRAVAGEGVELPVSSDHDNVVNYAPIIEELGLGVWLGSLTGTECSSLVWGHVNAFPLVIDPMRTGGGSPRWLGRAPGEVFTALRGDDPTRIVQINHPRNGTDSLFDVIDLDPATLTAERNPTSIGLPATANLSDLSFDALEVANMIADEDFEEVLEDWLAMVAAGHPAAATGSSDSHDARSFSGEARTYVYVGVGNDNPATVDPAAVVAAIRARRVVVGTGAFVTAGIVHNAQTSLPGETVDLTGAPNAVLHVRVQAAPWQPLAKIRIYQGTTEVKQITLDPADTATIRYDADVTFATPTADTFWVVRVDPSGAGDPVLDGPLPAITNPLFAHVE